MYFSLHFKECWLSSFWETKTQAAVCKQSAAANTFAHLDTAHHTIISPKHWSQSRFSRNPIEKVLISTLYSSPSSSKYFFNTIFLITNFYRKITSTVLETFTRAYVRHELNYVHISIFVKIFWTMDPGKALVGVWVSNKIGDSRNQHLYVSKLIAKRRAQ